MTPDWIEKLWGLDDGLGHGGVWGESDGLGDFAIAGAGKESQAKAVYRRFFRLGMVVCVLVSLAFAIWPWFRPYERGADPRAGVTVSAVQVKKDLKYYWVDIRLDVAKGQRYDWQHKPMLVLADGGTLEAADTQMSREESSGQERLWLKFWLDEASMKQRMVLAIGQGRLKIRTGEGLPDLGKDELQVYGTMNW